MNVRRDRFSAEVAGAREGGFHGSCQVVPSASPAILFGGAPDERPSQPTSLGESLAHGRLDNAVRLALGNTPISAAVAVFISNLPAQPRRSYLIDLDGCPGSRAACQAIMDRLEAGSEANASAEDLFRFFREMAQDGLSSSEHVSFMVSSAGTGDLLLFLRARLGSQGWRGEVEERLGVAGPLLVELAGAEWTMRRASRRLSLIESALDEMSLALFVLDARARAFCLNAAAFSRLAMADAFRLTRAGVLSCVHPKDTQALHQAVRSIVQMPPNELHEEPLVVTTLDGERMVATLRGVCARGGEADNRAAILMIQHEVRLSRAAFDALGLTSSEQRFLATFLYCSDLVVTAARLNLSEETARTYLKRICSKLGVRKQVELAAFVWNLSPPLRRKPDMMDARPPGALGRLHCLRPSFK